MPDHFKTWLDFIHFASAVKHSSRYTPTDLTTSFLDGLLQSSEQRHRSVTKRWAVWRAQVGHGTYEGDDEEHPWAEPRPYSPGRMIPLPYSAFEGRVNSKGIPCLYVATDRRTAMSEVRPWIGSTLSLGQFQLTKDLKLIDFSVGHDSAFEPLLEEPTSEDLDQNIWAQVDRAFSEPVDATPSTAEYIPTQVIAEFFRVNGFDGVVYKSKLGSGFNIALFDIAAAELINCSLVTVNGLSFTFGELEKTYYTKHSLPEV